MVRLWCLPLLLVLASPALATQSEAIPGTRASFTLIQEPGTYQNRSFVRLAEVNDTLGKTALYAYCMRGDTPEVWLRLSS